MTGKTYPLEPLLALMHMSPNQALLKLGVSGSRQGPYRRDGVSDRVAENLALKAGFHPAEVWPEIIEDRLASMSIRCVECGEMFVPSRKGHRYCTLLCRNRAKQRRWFRERYASDPEFRARKIERTRKERAAVSDTGRRVRRIKRAKARAANSESYNERQRAWYAANRESYNAHRRARHAARRAAEKTAA